MVKSPFALGERELRIAARLGFAKDGSVRAGRLAAVLIIIAWLPLLILTLSAGSAYGSQVTVPLLADYLPYGRYLIALPLLIFLHPIVDGMIARAIATVRASGLLADADQASLQGLLDRARALWRSPRVRLLLVAASLLALLLPLPAGSLITVSHWMFPAKADAGLLSPAGWWGFIVGGTLVRLLMLFAFWKLVMWIWFLWRLSRLPLRYQPLHPDRCGGIGFLDQVSIGFALLAAALGVQLGCIIADAVTYQGQQLMSFKFAAAAFVTLIVVLLFGPLLAFLGPLMSARVRAEIELRAWVTPAAQQVGSSLQQTSQEAITSLLSAQDLSTLTASGALLDGTVQMRTAPIGAKALKSVLAVTVLAVLLPLLPLLPLKQIAARLAGIVL